jgi:hypothetical protein
MQEDELKITAKDYIWFRPNLAPIQKMLISTMVKEWVFELLDMCLVMFRHCVSIEMGSSKSMKNGT